MSKSTKIVMWIVVVLIVLGAGWWIFGMSQSGSPSANVPGYQSGNASGTPAPAADNSDQAIGQSMANVDAQVSAFSSDSAAVDQGLNDQPVPQQQL